MFDGDKLSPELLLTTRQRTTLRNAFNNISTNAKLSKTQISKITHLGDFLGALLSKIVDPLMKAAVPLAKKHFGTIRSNSSISNRCRNSKKIHGSGMTTLIILNKKMNDI